MRGRRWVVAVAAGVVALLVAPGVAGAQVAPVEVTVAKYVVGESPGGDWEILVECPETDPVELTLGDEEWSAPFELPADADCLLTEVDARGADEVELMVVADDGDIVATGSLADPTEASFEVPLDDPDATSYVALVWNIYGQPDICDIGETLSEDLVDVLLELDGEQPITPEQLETVLVEVVGLLVEGMPLVQAGPVADAWAQALANMVGINNLLAQVGYVEGDLTEGQVDLLIAMLDEAGDAFATIDPWLLEQCPLITTTTSTTPTTVAPPTTAAPTTAAPTTTTRATTPSPAAVATPRYTG